MATPRYHVGCWRINIVVMKVTERRYDAKYIKKYLNIVNEPRENLIECYPLIEKC